MSDHRRRVGSLKDVNDLAGLITAGVLSWITGGQHIGYLAQKEDNEVVYSNRGLLA